MYKAVVFFDLDKTLLNRHKKINHSSLVALKELRQNHVLPIIASGRNVSMIQPIIRKTRIHNAVCDNGSNLIYHGKSIHSEPIPTETLNKLVETTKKLQDPLAFQTTSQVAFNTRKRIPKASIKRYQYPPVKHNFYLHHRVIYISLFTSNHKHDHFYRQKFGNILDLVRNCSVCLDVTKKGVNKGYGVGKMIELLKLANIPSFCFGNGLNDIPMFKQVDYPISMANGEECKKYAKYITGDCDKDGIAQGLKHYHLI